MTNDLDLAGLNVFQAHAISFSRLRRIHLLSITDVVVTVRSSINDFIGGWRTPVFIIGPRHSISADFTIIFMARVKRKAESVQPVMVHLSSLCQSEIIILEEILIWKLSGLIRRFCQVPIYAGWNRMRSRGPTTKQWGHPSFLWLPSIPG